jgi:superoxide dismutase
VKDKYTGEVATRVAVASPDDIDRAIDPTVEATEPVLTIDVWEHAYYIDFRNERAKYVDGLMMSAKKGSRP